MGTMKRGNNGGGGEIVQVQGGHIVRATGRKDRHSKVFTSKGPRDRRVRLSAHTAIQFYDVQDRLGFDRPSKAVDWLITKAKPSIDKLADLPPWHPTTNPPPPNDDDVADPDPPDCGGYAAADGGGSSFMPPPELDSDSMKLFFPTSSQDLGLSLHSNFHGGQAAALFAAPDPDGFGSGGAYQRLMGWGGSTSLGLTENPQPPPRPASSGGFFLINHNNMSQPLMMIPQRVPLQSSNNNIQVSPPVPTLGGFDELQNHSSVFRRGRFVDHPVGFGFQGREEEHNGGLPPSSSSNLGHH